MSKNRALARIGCFWSFGLICAIAEYASGLHEIKTIMELNADYRSIVNRSGDSETTASLIVYYNNDYGDYDYVELHNYCRWIKVINTYFDIQEIHPEMS